MKFLSLRIIGALLILSAFLCCFLVNCTPKSSIEPEEETEEEIKEEIKILTTFNVTYTLEGTETAGTVSYVGNDIDITVNIGEQTDLGTAPEGETRDVTVYVKGDGALERVFNNIPMSGTKIYTTDVLKLEGFHWEYFHTSTAPHPAQAFVWTDNLNPRWEPKTITVFLNPAPLTGERFTEESKVIIRQAIDAMKNSSRGYIQSVNYLDGDKEDVTVSNRPEYGEIWMYPGAPLWWPRPTLPMLNSNWPGHHVESSAIWLTGIHVGYPSVNFHEIWDALTENNQNGHPNWENDYPQKWWPYLFLRPISDEHNGDPYHYRIYPDHEEEEGFTEGVSGSIEEGESVEVLVKYENLPDLTVPPKFFRDRDDSYIKIKHIIREIPSKDTHKKEKK